MSNNTILSPFVYWAQDVNNIYLKIDLRDVTNIDVDISAKKFQFSALGIGTRGKNHYGLQLGFYKEIDSLANDEANSYVISPKCIKFVLPKKEKGVEHTWPRLLAQGSDKPPWLKIDFERWTDPELEAEEAEDDDGQRFLYQNQANWEEEEARRIVDEISRDITKKKTLWPELRTFYLFLFNLFLSVAWIAIVSELIYYYVKEREDYFSRVWDEISTRLILCQMAQWLELGHAYFGFVKSSWLPSLMQNSGRSFIIGLLYTEPSLQHKPFVFYLFVVWSLIEIVRYPYYVTQVVNRDIGFLTWLRYTMWIPLYPLGIFVEGVIILRAIPIFQSHGRFWWNIGNIRIDGSHLLIIYLCVCLLPGAAYNIYYMRKQRVNKLFPQRIKRKLH